MCKDFSATRQRIHDKAHRYFTFQRLSRDQKNLFFGATDALLDTDIAASHFSAGFRSCAESRLLLCYGFLQMLYVQQDAVRCLSKAVNIRWYPNQNACLRRVREARDRIVGHPAEADPNRNGVISSAIISQHDISEVGFSGHIYYSDKFENGRVDIAEFVSLNRDGLLAQMLEVEAAMDRGEQALRAELSMQPFQRHFGVNFDYLLQRLWCSLANDDRRIQAESHASMIRDILDQLRDSLRSKGLADHAESSNFRIALLGLDQIVRIIQAGDLGVDSQDQFDLIYRGVAHYLNEIIIETRNLDDRLGSPIQ